MSLDDTTRVPDRPLPCPQCGYDLRGSVGDRVTCPECGAQVRRAVLNAHLDRARRGRVLQQALDTAAAGVVLAVVMASACLIAPSGTCVLAAWVVSPALTFLAASPVVRAMHQFSVPRGAWLLPVAGYVAWTALMAGYVLFVPLAALAAWWRALGWTAILGGGQAAAMTLLAALLFAAYVLGLRRLAAWRKARERRVTALMEIAQADWPASES
ncbi:MAG: zinc ribbon domain-containing protein [Phycisphaerae bacterium]|nr:zinc ribbon domain-containing protein [Phycisphaerae bacterium]MCZ2399600.1 zinc ribbon domain-containing protein [Phycisphaerae bacterium]NUQ49941.1 zinc ribbon domain-containing protein [Phycisphaerae bacterium]